MFWRFRSFVAHDSQPQRSWLTTVARKSLFLVLVCRLLLHKTLRLIEENICLADFIRVFISVSSFRSDVMRDPRYLKVSVWEMKLLSFIWISFVALMCCSSEVLLMLIVFSHYCCRHSNRSFF